MPAMLSRERPEKHRAHGALLQISRRALYERAMPAMLCATVCPRRSNASGWWAALRMDPGSQLGTICATSRTTPAS